MEGKSSKPGRAHWVEFSVEASVGVLLHAYEYLSYSWWWNSMKTLVIFGSHINQGNQEQINFMFCWPCISIYLCNKPDALFILSLYRQSTSTCFGHICSPSSGGILYIYNNWYVLCSIVDCLLAELEWNWFRSNPAIVCLWNVQNLKKRRKKNK